MKNDKQSNTTISKHLSKQMKCTRDYVLPLMLIWNMEPSYVLIAHIIWIGFSIFFIIFLHLFMFRRYIHRIACIKDHYIYVNEFGRRHRIFIRMLNGMNMVYKYNGKPKTTKAFSIQHSILCAKWWFYVKYIPKENNNICFLWFNLDFSSLTDLLFGPQKLSRLSDI